jgi:hypothetical protein
MLTECYSGLSFKFFLHFSMRFFTLENKLASEIGRDAVKVINDINTKSSEHNRPRSSQGPTRVNQSHWLVYLALLHY